MTTTGILGGMTTTMTTIKVPVTIRDLLRERAEADHVTQAEVIQRLFDAERRAEILIAAATWEPDEEYLAEMREWDVTLLDGLTDSGVPA